MKIKKWSSTSERLVLTAMIVDSTVLGRISSKWQKDIFRSEWSNTIASWCIKYFNKYEKAPVKHIENIFNSWSNRTEDKEIIKLIGQFLNSLSDEYEELEKEINSDYVLDIAGKYFNQVKIERLIESVQNDIDLDKVEKAHNQISSFNKIEMGIGEGIDILQDKEAIREAFEDKKEPLIIYPGALGVFFKDALERDAFISFMAPEKRGKTFWLIDIAYRGMLQRRKVAFFEVGDLSQNQIMRRLMIRVSARPFYPCSIKYPIDIQKLSNSDEVEIISKRKTYSEYLSWQKARKACKSVMRKKIRSKQSFFRLSCHPNSTLNIKAMQNILQDWEREGWVPDVIIIDYADILNMEHHGLEGRDRINEIWKQLRSLSQTYHCLVVTATQSDAASYDVDTIRKKHFSEDKRKLAHITGMIGINSTEDEKEKGIMRLNWIVLRESEFSENKCVYVAGCLAIGNPAIRSCFENRKGDE